MKQKQANVEVMPATAPSWSSVQAGSAGPAAQVYETSALQPLAPATAATLVALTKEQTQNVCYKCFLLGDRTKQQCYLKTAEGDLTSGHKGAKAGRDIECQLFDNAYPAEPEHANRAAKIVEAQKAKRKAVRWFADQEKKNSS